MRKKIAKAGRSYFEGRRFDRRYFGYHDFRNVSIDIASWSMCPAQYFDERLQANFVV